MTNRMLAIPLLWWSILSKCRNIEEICKPNMITKSKTVCKHVVYPTGQVILRFWMISSSLHPELLFCFHNWHVSILLRRESSITVFCICMFLSRSSRYSLNINFPSSMLQRVAIKRFRFGLDVYL